MHIFLLHFELKMGACQLRFNDFILSLRMMSKLIDGMKTLKELISWKALILCFSAGLQHCLFSFETHF